MHFLITGPVPEADIQNMLESSGFNASCKAYIQHHWDKAISGLSHEQIDEVREWWGPGWPALFPRDIEGLRKGFYNEVSRSALDAINYLVAVGLG